MRLRCLYNLIMRFWTFSHNSRHSNTQQDEPKIEYEKPRATIDLPAPNKTGGMPLSEALGKRRSIRITSSERISNQQLSDLLWAACGINGERMIGARTNYIHTNPTACNHQEVMVYVFMKEGVYLYDSVNNCLGQIKNKDYRNRLSKLHFVRNSAISLCLVSDINKMTRFDDKYKIDRYSLMDIGYVSENIYLHCAANGLSTCACGMINRERIAKTLGLINCHVFLIHPIGIVKE